MGLHCNGYRLGFAPHKMIGGALISIYTPARAPRYSPGPIRSLQLTTGTLTALPQGNKAPSAWMLPQVSGGMSSHNRCALTLSGAGAGALGRNAVGTAAVSINATALGGLIAGGVGNATISLTAGGAIVATIGTTGAAIVTIGGVANPGALGWLQGEAGVSITGDLIAYAVGHMTGTTEEQGLSVAGITNAVWNKIVDSGFSAQEILRLLAAVAAGDADGLESGAPEYLSLDGQTTRIAATYSAGTRIVTARDAA
jgi:hypothetical protein